MCGNMQEKCKSVDSLGRSVFHQFTCVDFKLKVNCVFPLGLTDRAVSSL